MGERHTGLSSVRRFHINPFRFLERLAPRSQPTLSPRVVSNLRVPSRDPLARVGVLHQLLIDRSLTRVVTTTMVMRDNALRRVSAFHRSRKTRCKPSGSAGSLS